MYPSIWFEIWPNSNMKFFYISFVIFLSFQMLFVDADKNVEVDEISEIHGVKHHNYSESIAKNIDRGYFEWERLIIPSMQQQDE